MDFVGYAERAAPLVNAPLADDDDLREMLADRELADPEGRRARPRALRRFQRELRPVFEAASADDDDAVVERLNALLAKHPVTPYIAGHDAQSWHLHVADRASSVAELLVAESLMGLAVSSATSAPPGSGCATRPRATTSSSTPRRTSPAATARTGAPRGPTSRPTGPGSAKAEPPRPSGRRPHPAPAQADTA